MNNKMNCVILYNKDRYVRYSFAINNIYKKDFFLINVIDIKFLENLYNLFGYENVLNMSLTKNFFLNQYSNFKDNTYICFTDKNVFLDYYLYEIKNFNVIGISYNGFFLNNLFNLFNLTSLILINFYFIIYFVFFILFFF